MRHIRHTGFALTTPRGGVRPCALCDVVCRPDSCCVLAPPLDCLQKARSQATASPPRPDSRPPSPVPPSSSSRCRPPGRRAPHPLALALYYFALAKRFKIAGMRNKHDQPGGYTQVPCVHMMIDWEGSGYLVEVMLMLTAFLEIKKMQHHAYDIIRVNHVMDLMAGIGVEDEVTKLKRENVQKDAENAALKAALVALFVLVVAIWWAS